MALPRTDATDGLTVADVMHHEFAAIPATTTVAEARAWFAASASRRLALVADQGRYVGSLTPSDVAVPVATQRPVVEVARTGPTVAPDAAAEVGLDLVLASDSRRIPVVDGDGVLHGVLAVTSDLRYFACRDRAVR
jgi:CBS domain-containing protein